MNKKSIVIAVCVVLLVIAVGVIVWLYSSLQATQRSATEAVQAQATQQELALENQLKITWPTRGSQLCYEEPYTVSWQAPADMEAVSAYLYVADAPTPNVKLGDYPAVTGTGGNLGYGQFAWDLTDSTGTVVPASKVYKLSISGMYHGHEISTSTDGLFSIGNCNTH